MATFFRSLVRAGPSRPSPTLLTRNFTAPTFPTYQQSPLFNSTPSSTSPPFSPKKTYQPNPYGLESSKPNPPLAPIIPPADQNIKMPTNRGEEEVDDKSDAWWAHLSNPGKLGKVPPAMPGNQYSGRSVRVYMSDTMKAYKQLSGLLGRSGVKKHVRRGEFYEKPSERKRRLGTERHRRRFQEMVREKVQTVQMIRNRG